VVFFGALPRCNIDWEGNTKQVAMDSSHFSDKALQRALTVAETNPVHIFLLFVVPDMQVVVFGRRAGVLEEMEAVKNAEKFLCEIGHSLTDASVPHTLLLGRGEPKEVIIQQAKENNIDLLVLGQKGTSDLKRVLVGSVSRYVSEKASCPVWIVK